MKSWVVYIDILKIMRILLPKKRKDAEQAAINFFHNMFTFSSVCPLRPFTMYHNEKITAFGANKSYFKLWACPLLGTSSWHITVSECLIFNMEIVIILILWDNNERDDNIYDGDLKIVLIIPVVILLLTYVWVWKYFH